MMYMVHTSSIIGKEASRGLRDWGGMCTLSYSWPMRGNVVEYEDALEDRQSKEHPTCVLESYYG